MTTTAIDKGKIITATSTETAYTLAGDHAGAVTTVFLTWVSGTFQYTTGPQANATPKLDGTYATISAARTIPVDLDNANSSIRISGSGTLIIDY